MREVTFYFDVVCPYAYLGSTQIEAVCARAGARLTYHPMLLGGVFQAIGRKEVPTSEARRAASQGDFARQVRRLGVPFAWPAEHPRRTVDAMRLCVAAGDKVPEVAHALYRAYWVDGLDVADRGVLARIAAAHDVDLAAVDRQEIKDRLRKNTDEAVAAGVFGAPSFLVENEHGRFLFFGQDRLHFVEKALGGWKVPA